MIGLGAIFGCSTMTSSRKTQLFYRSLPGLKATSSCLTVVMLICFETVLLSTVSNCAKTFYMHWNTTNSIFRIDNTDHIIDVNKGNLPFEYDQVHIICPVYEPGTFDNETEKYIIYNVSKIEYETCRITDPNPRIIAICDKPQRMMFFTITFRPFTPQPGGLEFLPGHDYYFISTSSKGDLHRRIGGRCTSNNMKVMFKVCCAPNEGRNSSINYNVFLKPSTSSSPQTGVSLNTNNDHNSDAYNTRSTSLLSTNDKNNKNNDNGGGDDGVELIVPPIPNINTNDSNVVQSTMSWPGWRHPQNTPVSTTLSVQPFIPYKTSPRPTLISTVNNNHTFNSNLYNKNNNYSNYNNNSPSHKPTKKTNEFGNHPNEVVKNEELTYSNSTQAIFNPYSLNKLLISILLALVTVSVSRWFNFINT